MYKIIFTYTIFSLFYGCSSKLGNKTNTANMIKVPRGYFIMGSDDSDGKIGVQIGVDEFPKRKVYLSTFYIDKYETTIGEYRKFLNATGNKPPLIWFDPDFQYYKLEDNHPIIDISWYEAKAYCKWMGKRLPYEKEWEKAARGVDGRKYPWGDTFDKKKCNMQVKDKNGLYWTVPVDSMPEGQSPYGVYNMCGNVSEWTASKYKPYPNNALNRGRFEQNKYVLRGGAYELDSPPFGRTADRHPAYPNNNMPTNGVRCVTD